MTVDSEAIFALAAHSHNDAARARGSSRLDGDRVARRARPRRRSSLARGVGRPLWIGRGRHELFFASTRAALEVVERYAGVKLRKRELGDGTFLDLPRRPGRPRGAVPPRTTLPDPIVLPAVRAPEEGVSCLERLAVLAAAA